MDKTDGFVEVKIGPGQGHSRPDVSLNFIEISCPSGALIKIPTRMDTNTLLAVLAALAG